MADTKITALTALTAADPINDVIPIVDVSDTSMAASGTTKKISVNNILGASGTATLASATITGDLTVRTTKLFVNATGVGVNYTSPSAALHIGTTGATNKLAINTAVINAGDIQLRRGSFIGFSSAIDNANSEYLFANAGALEFGVNASTRFAIASNGVATWSDVGGVAGTAMTLNATGLGIGVSPNQKFVCAGPRAYFAGGGAVYGIGIGFNTTRTAADQVFFLGATDSATPDLVFSGASGAALMRLNSSGNVGIGVTPSTWAAGAKALQISSFVHIAQQSNGSSNVGFACYESSTNAFEYSTTGDSPTLYSQLNGQHKFFTAPSGTAGLAITFTQAMTLDASGNLLVGTVTAPAGTKVGAIAKLSGVSLEGTASINVSTTPVALAKDLGTGGLFFVTGYNISGGTQCWFLVASQQAVAPTVIASSNSTGLTVAFTLIGGIVHMNTTSGTIAVNSFAVTN